MNELTIPMDNGRFTVVPFPMSQDDFDLLSGTLQLWRGKLVSVGAALAAAERPAAAHVPIEVRSTAPRKRTPRRATGEPTIVEKRAIQVGPTPLTLTNEVMRAALGLDFDLARNTLLLWHGYGWVRRVGRGLYERTEKWPSASKAESHAEIVPNRPPPIQLSGEDLTGFKLQPPPSKSETASTASERLAHIVGAWPDLGPPEKKVLSAVNALPHPTTVAQVVIRTGMSQDVAGILLIKLERKEYLTSVTDDGVKLYTPTKKAKP